MKKLIILILTTTGLVNFCNAVKYYIKNNSSKVALVTFDKGAKFGEHTYRVSNGKRAEPISFTYVGSIDISDALCNQMYSKKFKGANLTKNKFILIGNNPYESDVKTIKNMDEFMSITGWPKNGDAGWGKKEKENECK